jgi:hypothetical protein
MNVKIYSRRKRYYADLEGLPGSPPIGDGRTPQEAVACLFARLVGMNGEQTEWFNYVDKNTLFINGKPWEDNPLASKR